MVLSVSAYMLHLAKMVALLNIRLRWLQLFHKSAFSV